MYNSFELEKLREDNPRNSSKLPFEHQKDAFEKLSGLFSFKSNEHKSGILVLPTDAGKTFTSVIWICRNVLSKNVKVLWLAHTGHDGSYMWQTFYKSYDRFKTAFDSQRNRIFHVKRFGTEPVLKIDEPVIKTIEQRELTEDEKKQVFQKDKYTCQCCGKTKEPGRKVKFQVDHVSPFKFGGETRMSNSQTLCSICNRIKDVHEINFRVYRTRLATPKGTLEWNAPSDAEYETEVIKRTVNTFYHCQAVSEIKLGERSNSKHYSVWEICLFEGNNPKWLSKHSKELVYRFLNIRTNVIFD